jgi:aspartyl-tRNA(Asn)/glutamyl-tRNA(Gln) amidotransferase subunit B
MTIGLEVHVELKTSSKIFCSCATDFGAGANTQTCPICLGMPGTLPVLNKKAIEYAIMAGLATDCKINLNCKMDRKNYFYPDLPKAYQISQYDMPLCVKGYLDIATTEGEKRIGITRIHLEEDAGKLIHNDELGTMIDCNRCGVPLIEIVTEPDFESAEQVDVFLNKLRTIMLNLGISDCRMNEGSFRADVNLSVRKQTDELLGTRTEMKNLNSFAFIQKAIEYEFVRQVDSLIADKKIVQETRRYDEKSKKTYSMREKEDADDYRYFPDPDLVPINLTDEYIESIKRALPVLAKDKKPQMMKNYGLSSFDSEMLVSDMNIATLYEAAASLTSAYKILANLMIPLSDKALEIKAERWAKIADMSDTEQINTGTAKKLIDMLLDEDFDPQQQVEIKNMFQINDEQKLKEYVIKAISLNTKAVESYKSGNFQALGPIVGYVMKITRGLANPTKVNDIALDILYNMKV